MLPLPALSTAASPKSIDAKSAPAGQDKGDGFGDFLDAVTEGPLPAEIKKELVKQVEDGVPMSEVLAHLLEHVRDNPDVSLVPGMVPVLQAMAPQLQIPADTLPKDGVLALGRQANGQPPPGVTDTDGEAQTEDVAPGDVPAGDELLGKHKALLAGRVGALEATAAVPAQANATHIAALKVLDLPASGNHAAQGAATGLDRQSLLAPKVGDAQWGQALAQRVVWMVGNDRQSAQLNLNPAHLGPLEVKLTLHHDQASLSLLASNGAVRDALEQALPRLRDMLGQQDIQLAQVNVGYRQDAQGGSAEGSGSGAGSGSAFGPDDGLEDAQPVTESIQSAIGRGLVDAYA